MCRNQVSNVASSCIVKIKAFSGITKTAHVHLQISILSPNFAELALFLYTRSPHLENPRDIHACITWWSKLTKKWDGETNRQQRNDLCVRCQPACTSYTRTSSITQITWKNILERNILQLPYSNILELSMYGGDGKTFKQENTGKPPLAEYSI